MSWSSITSGEPIEVLSDDGATWRPARLIHAFLSRPLYFVLLDGGAGRATVDASRVRRRSDPSSSAAAGFDRHQHVEAFVDGAWRAGVVSKVHLAGGERRYNVCFPHPRQQAEVGAAEIRARGDYAQDKHKTVKLQKLGGQKSAFRKRKLAGSATASCSCDPCREAALRQSPFPAPNSGNGNIDRFRSQDKLESSQYCNKEKKKKTADDNPDLLDLRDRETYSMKTRCGVRTPIIEEPKFYIKSLGEKGCSSGQFEKMNAASPGSIAKPSLDILLDDPLIPENSGQDKPVNNSGEEPSKERPANPALLQKHMGVRQHTSRENRRKNSRPQKLKIIEPSLEGDSIGNQPENTMIQIGGLPMNKCSTSKFSDNGLESQIPFNVIEGSSDPSLVETSASGVQLSEAENGGKIIVELQIGGLSINKCRASKFSDNGLESQEPFNVVENSSDPSLVETSDSGVQLSEAGNKGKFVSESQIGGLLINKSGASTFSDKGLGSQERYVIEGSSDPSLVETSASCVQLSEAGNEGKIDVLPSTVGGQLEKRAIVEKAGDALKTRPDKLPEEQLSLPFEKCSFMWDSIDSMEVFSLMPQHPHFRPLGEYQKDFREGMAIGLMVTFTNLVNSIGKLEITDPHDKFNDMLKILENLEAHGFGVRQLQNRLVELLRKKENQERFMNDQSKLEVALMRRKRENIQLDSELEIVDKAIKELEQSLSCLHEKKVHVSEQKRENDSTMGKLEVELKRVEDAFLSAKHDFEATLSAKWKNWASKADTVQPVPVIIQERHYNDSSDA